MTNDVLVLGAGVIGLTTAVCLAESDHRVRVWAELLPRESTSAAASGLWVPGFTPRELEWSRTSYTEFSKLAQEPDTGVHTERGLAVTDMWAVPPEWIDECPELQMCGIDELPDGMLLGWWSTPPLIDMPVYFDHLTERLTAAGVTIERRKVRELSEAAESAPVVVNCTGVGAGKLANDPTVAPVRGQHVVVRNPGIDHWFIQGMDTPEWTGFFPHGDHILLAGVSQHGDWNLEPDPEVAARIISRCADVEPRLGEAEVIGHTVGLRAGRDSARLEEETVGSTQLVHAYGHGSFGVSQSWGTARDVERLLASN